MVPTLNSRLAITENLWSQVTSIVQRIYVQVACDHTDTFMAVVGQT